MHQKPYYIHSLHSYTYSSILRVKYRMNKKPLLYLIVILSIVVFSLPILCISIHSQAVVSPQRFTIVIDAGHGGIDSGATGVLTKNKESDLNLDISLKLGQKLEQIGLNVVYTRTTQDGLYGTTDSGYKRRDMEKRRSIVKSSCCDLVVSIHLNKFSDPNRRGAQVYYQQSDATSLPLAKSIQDVLNQNINQPQQGRGFTPSQGDFWMCKIVKPAVIVECGFLSNQKDDLLFDTTEYREQIAYLIFDGIVSYLTINTSFYPV